VIERLLRIHLTTGVEVQLHCLEQRRVSYNVNYDIMRIKAMCDPRSHLGDSLGPMGRPEIPVLRCTLETTTPTLHALYDTRP
jgi:hypothetical protein